MGHGGSRGLSENEKLQKQRDDAATSLALLPPELRQKASPIRNLLIEEFKMKMSYPGVTLKMLEPWGEQHNLSKKVLKAWYYLYHDDIKESMKMRYRDLPHLKVAYRNLFKGVKKGKLGFIKTYLQIIDEMPKKPGSKTLNQFYIGQGVEGAISAVDKRSKRISV